MKLLSYLRLCRFPTLFTALADICLGFLMSHAMLQPTAEFVWLLGASAGLYLSGMVFNDVFDVKQDTQERPQRPIPSGAVPLPNAIAFGTGLMLAGIACAFLASMNSFYVALILAATILAYDSFGKRTFLGPVLMGSCRFLNVILGASSGAAWFAIVWQNPQLWVGLSLGIYIVGVTLFARNEAKENARVPLGIGLLIANLGLVMLALWMSGMTSRLRLFVVPGAMSGSMSVLFLLAVIALTINRRALKAIANPIPQEIQPTIGTMLLSLIVLDAMLIYFKLGQPGVPYAIGTVALLAPAIVLRKWISMT